MASASKSGQVSSVELDVAPVVVRGTNDKPVASEALAQVFASSRNLDGQLLIGYPIIGTATGRHPIDAVYVSPTRGLIVFDLVDGPDLGAFADRQDDAATKLQSRLLTHSDLVARRQLRIPLETVTYAPGIPTRFLPDSADGYVVANAETLDEQLNRFTWATADDGIYERTLSAIQSISTIRRSRTGRIIADEQSRGARLQRVEDSIATLDNLQSKAVIETVTGVQRIRGLAGSGKTIVLALKAAYLHAQHPDWRMAITFNTRSLKGHFTKLINNFTIEQTGEEPNWDNVRIINGWGGPGGQSRSGIYFEFCNEHGIEFRDFVSARDKFGRNDAFQGACAEALIRVPNPKPLYDVILVDEAQDFPPEFLRMCYSMLDSDKRLVYAYDELQNLSGVGLPPAEEIFGQSQSGEPNVSFDDPIGTVGARRDIILEKCYRNSRPLLVTAHALGFGMYREPPKGKSTGLVQMFSDTALWTDIGYSVKSGQLSAGKHVVLQRTAETSPRFLEEHSPLADLVSFHLFENERQQATWVAGQIEQNLTVDELRHDDVVVINTDPITTRSKLGPIRKALLDKSIMGHIAGVDSSADVFFRDSDSVTFTGIFRAKGNEAAMVYIVNAQECHTDRANLAQLRNRLFTAITRSKAWVRVTGIGPAMAQLIEEFEAVRASNFELDFRYPTPKEQAQLQIVHRDMSAAEKKNIQKRESSLLDLLADIESGRIFAEDLDDELVSRLRGILGAERD
jgi:superfamily I DNA and RNA helicase